MTGRLGRIPQRLREELHDALNEDNTPQEIAASFSLGVFITSLPTLGAGFLVFGLVTYVSERISPIALLASLIIMNPVVKWGVYAASLWLGVQILGPIPGGTPSSISMSAGSDVVVRLLAGNAVISVLFTAVSYPLALRATKECQRRNIDPVENPKELLADD